MNDLDLKTLWKEQPMTPATITLDDIKTSAAKFERTTKWRNIREWAAVLFVVPVFSWLAISTSSLLTRAGALCIVAAAIFTSCAGPCPKITGQMRRLQDELEGTDVRLVSVSVDPEFDTPERLRDYAETWGADGERWSFLTGDKEAIYELVQRGFWLAAQEDPEAPRGFHVTHKSSIVAVDREGVRRGWYDGTDEKATDRLIERMRFLAQD